MWRFGLSLMLPLFAAIPAALAQSEPPLVALEPIVSLANGKIAVCGLKAAFGRNDQASASIEILLQRDAAIATIVVRVTSNLKNATVRILRPTPLETFRTQRRDRSVELTASANDPSATDFLRNTMTFGADVQLSAPSEAMVLKLPSPIPPSVRAAYLNCAGDLYRPGE